MEHLPAGPGSTSVTHAPPPPPDGLHVRHLRTQEEYVACVALQEETWGADFSERVPAAILKVSQRLGGITAGAPDAPDRLPRVVVRIIGVAGAGRKAPGRKRRRL